MNKPIKWEDYAEFTFDGFVSTERVRNGNALGSTGLAWAQIKLSGGEVTTDQYSKVLNACDPKRIGVYNRGPGKDSDYQSHEDAWPLVLALSGTREARRIFDWGAWHWWCFNNINPGKFRFGSWFGRFPTLIASMHFAAGIKPNAIYRIWMTFELYIQGEMPRKNHDGWVRMWCAAQTFLHSGVESRMCRWGVNRMFHRMKEREITMSAIYADYTGMREHPLVKGFEVIGA